MHREEIKLHSNRTVRIILAIAGTIFVAVGILGMFLPLLPTTIFLLLAAWCYARSSEKFYHWLHHNKLFGKYLKNYRRGNGMTLLSKIVSLTLLWTTILYSALFATNKLYVQLILFAIAIGVTIHLLTIKTAKHIEQE